MDDRAPYGREYGRDYERGYQRDYDRYDRGYNRGYDEMRPRRDERPRRRAFEEEAAL